MALCVPAAITAMICVTATGTIIVSVNVTIAACLMHVVTVVVPAVAGRKRKETDDENAGSHLIAISHGGSPEHGKKSIALRAYAKDCRYGYANACSNTESTSRIVKSHC